MWCQHYNHRQQTMKTKLHLTIILLTWAFIIHAQVSEQWTATYNGTGSNSDDIKAMVVDSSGNVYVTGNSTPAPLGYGTDIVTIKYNSAGVQQWLATYNGTLNNNDFAGAIAIDASGNAYVTGQTNNGTNDYDIVTIKYNSAGIEQWASAYNGAGSGPDIGLAITVGTSGDVYVTGLDGSSGGSSGTITIKYNSSGVQQWAALLLLGGYGASISVDNAGSSYIVTTYSGDIAAVKYDNTGVQQWLSSYSSPGTNQNYGKSLKLDAAGNVYILGGIDNGAYSKDIVTIKYDIAGVQQWATVYTNEDDSPTSLHIDSQGNVYVSGYIYKINTTYDYDGVTIKYNSSGVQQWASVYNPAGNVSNQNISVIDDNTGNVYVTGYENSPLYDQDIVTIKYNSAGIQQWLIKYASAGGYSDAPKAIGLDGNNNVYVAGYTATSGVSGSDYIVVKYSQGSNSVFEETVNNEVIVFPNPFASVTTLHTTKIFKNGSLILYNSRGQKVKQMKNISGQTIHLFSDDLPNGIYFFQLTQDGKIFSTNQLVINNK